MHLWKLPPKYSTAICSKIFRLGEINVYVQAQSTSYLSQHFMFFILKTFLTSVQQNFFFNYCFSSTPCNPSFPFWNARHVKNMLHRTQPSLPHMSRTLTAKTLKNQHEKLKFTVKVWLFVFPLFMSKNKSDPTDSHLHE